MPRNDANTETGARIAGIVVRVTEKGFGFAEVHGNSYFIHFSNCGVGVWDEIEKRVGNGEKVEVTFEPTQTTKGLRALNVQLT